MSVGENIPLIVIKYRLPEFDADLWSMTRKLQILKNNTFALIRVDVILQHNCDSLDTFPSLLCISNPHQ